MPEKHRFERISSTNSVVVLGAFNPAIFSPSWVRSNEIIEFDDGAEPHVNITISEISDLIVSDVSILEPFRRTQSHFEDSQVLGFVIPSSC